MLVDEAVEALQSQVSDTAIIACSGGIDSTVAAILAHRAVGSLLHCVYVDTGLMRKHESEEVAEMCADMEIELKVVDASERFFSHLKGRLTEGTTYQNEDSLRQDLFVNIDCYYARYRKHSANSWKTPEQAEREFFDELDCHP